MTVKEFKEIVENIDDWYKDYIIVTDIQDNEGYPREIQDVEGFSLPNVGCYYFNLKFREK